ncbi:hypothetical protein GCM10010503_37900 [Streptomyces lucensis JCM 4490]|uniref:Uncharacterized protein n=1 Tax=Streptomyces lucensis JCM 4490 TaxID=1306176 RepID=A0A918J8W9_9ACTN|nr:hypothetical protein [Streptomyces lucensis]GGW57028.1 hypothetical protein GCM10010503_37900 [Streptomyces lucensis JCM 4490]
MTSDHPAPPTTAEQALDIVRSRFAELRLPDGSPVELRVQEFDIGYLVHAVFPPVTDVAGRPQPAPPGGSKIVVSKESGEAVTVPNYPTQAAIDLYRRQRS